MWFRLVFVLIAVGILSAPAHIPVHAQTGSPVLLLLGNFNAIDFGPTGVGVASAPQAVMLTNGGTADLSITSVAIGGVDSIEFNIVSSTCGSVAPGGLCAVTITFTPSANGARSARLLVSNNAPGAPHMIPLMGRGVDPAVPQRALGPIDPRHGFPFSYTDEAGVTLELCLDHTMSPVPPGEPGHPPNPMCLSPTPDPLQPPSLTDTAVNFPDEAFWWSGEASFDSPSGDVSALLVLAQEAAFLNELPAVGDQIAFGRVRFRLRGTGVQPNAWYRFTHPYGVDELQAEVDIFSTGDVGCFSSPCDFTQIFSSRISHFLRCVAPAPPAGYVGDPNAPCTVTGSPFGTNFFRVERISGPGGIVQALVGQTTEFAISGKLAGAIAAPPPPPTNSLPTAANDAAATLAGAAVTIQVLANDSDADGDPLSVSGITQPVGGAVVIGAGATSVIYTPAAGFSGVDQFTYSISDGRGGSATGSVSVTVTLPNRPPVANADAATTNAGVPVTISVLQNDSDPDLDPLTVISVGAITGGTAVINAGTTITYSPAAGFTGSGGFTYTISDGRGSTASANVTVTVNAVSTLPAGLVLALGFNETSGLTAIDRSPAQNNGTIREASRVAGQAGFGGALSFDGINDWVSVADAASLDLTTAMTFEAWVRPAALGGWRTVLMKERAGGLAFSLYADDGTAGARPASYMRIGTIDREVEGLGPLPINTWTHLATTFDGTTLRLYVNGTLVRSRAQSGAVVTSANPLRIGGNAIWGEFFAGLIDEVRVYNRVLAAAEILADMTSPLP